jgi:predicted  nucleic acid-binding Zn-ribbon protein
MAQVVPAGSDVSAGTYRCTNCGYELSVRSTQSLPPCPSCSAGQWNMVTGGDSAEDPYPGQQRAGRPSRRETSTSGSRRGSSQRRGRGAGDERTKEQLYREAKRLGIEGRSKMNKQQLAQAIGRRSAGQRARGDGQADTAHPVTVQAFLEGVNYPTRKGELLREARSQRASEDVRQTIERLPDRRFGDPTEVSEAIGNLR